MKLKTRSLSILTALILPAAVFAGNSSVVRSPLENTAVNPDAFGSVLSVLQSNRSIFAVDLGRLDAKQSYSLKVGEIVEALFTTDSKGRARVGFSTQAKKNKPLLDFDPRGKTVAVLDANGVAVLHAVISSEGEPVGVSVDERANLAAASGAKSKGAARYTARKNGKRSFEVIVSGLTATGLHLYVDGIDRGEIKLRGKSGRVEFRSESKGTQPVLDFDPRGAQIDLLDASGLQRFSGKLEAKAKGVNMATRATNRVIIPSTGSDPDGQAVAALRVREDARKDFSVEVENVPEGAYELLVNDTVQGTITVTARATGGTQGEIEFTGKAEDDAHELPLTFDPAGATLSIRQGATVFFTGVFDPGAGAAAPNPVTVTLISEVLASTGLDANASGEVEFSTQPNGEKEFEVEIEDVDAGKYQLFVGGTLRGTISAAADTNARVRGGLKFEKAGTAATTLRTAKRGGSDDGGSDDHGGGGGGTDDPAGDDHGGTGGGGSTGGGEKVPKLPLTFDARGQLIEIKSAAGTFFSHVLGDGSAPVAGGGGTVTVPGEIVVALISTGADSDATAHAQWQRDDRGGESFEVELEDLAAGSYDILVGDAVRGSISVVETDRGTRGKIKFDDTPATGELALDFDPVGKVITVRKADVVYFQRTFPSGS